MPSILVKSLAFDLLDTYTTDPLETRGGFRQFDFYLGGVKYLFPYSSPDIQQYIDPVPGSTFSVRAGFQTDNSLVGSSNNGWMSLSGAFDGNPLRIVVVFSSPIEIDSIVFNNFHSYGGSTYIGIKSLIITATEETLGQADVDGVIGPPSALPGAVEIFNGQVLEHVASNVPDNQVLALNLIPNYSVEIDAAIELFGGFEVRTPPGNSVELSAIIELFGGFEVDVDKSVELSAIIELFGGFTVDIDRTVELSAALELFGGFEIETSPLVGIELSAAIELFGGFEVSVDRSVEFSAIIELFGVFNVHIDDTECRLPKFNQKRWC